MGKAHSQNLYDTVTPTLVWNEPNALVVITFTSHHVQLEARIEKLLQGCLLSLLISGYASHRELDEANVTYQQWPVQMARAARQRCDLKVCLCSSCRWDVKASVSHGLHLISINHYRLFSSVSHQKCHWGHRVIPTRAWPIYRNWCFWIEDVLKQYFVPIFSSTREFGNFHAKTFQKHAECFPQNFSGRVENLLKTPFRPWDTKALHLKPGQQKQQ